MQINAYYNGELGSFGQIKLPLTDRAIFFGDGIYDAAIGRAGKIFMLREHLMRFFSNAGRLDLNPDVQEGELEALLRRLTRLSGEKEYFLYFQLSRFSETRAHSYRKDAPANLLVTVSPFSLPSEEKRLSLITLPDLRYKLCDVKTLNLLPAVLASGEASQRGADEAIFIKDGFVTECAHSNIHILKNGRLKTHPLSNEILPGISRAHLLCVCEQLGVEVEQKAFLHEELFSADAVIVTSSSKLGMIAESIDGMPLDLSKVEMAEALCRKMREDYLSATEC